MYKEFRAVNDAYARVKWKTVLDREFGWAVHLLDDNAGVL